MSNDPPANAQLALARPAWESAPGVHRPLPPRTSAADQFQRLLERAGEPVCGSGEKDQFTQESDAFLAPFLNVARPITTFGHLQSTAPASPSNAAGILHELAADMRSTVYVSNAQFPDRSHAVIKFDGVIAGASAELVRTGAVLQVRLHAHNDAAYRWMASRREALRSAIAAVTPLNVSVEVVYEEGKDHGCTA